MYASTAGDVSLDSAQMRNCNRDLISLLALPAMCVGQEPAVVVEMVLDVLVSMFRAEFVYARTCSPEGDIEVVRGPALDIREGAEREIGRSVARSISDEDCCKPCVVSVSERGQVSAVRVPLGIGGKLGEFVVASRHAAFPTATDRVLLRATANQLMVALQQALLRQAEKAARQQVEAAHDRLAAVLSVMDTMLGRLDFDEMLRELLSRVRAILKSDAATILLLTADRKELAVLASSGLLSDQPHGFRIPVGHGVAGTVAATCTPYVIPDIWKVDGVRPALHETLRAVAGVPLMVAGELLGVLRVASAESRDFSPEDVQLLQLVADRCALAIDRAKLIEELKHTVRVSELFTGILAHDLRNPLNAMKLGVQAVLMATKDERNARLLRRVESSRARMERMIEELLDFTRARLGGGIPVIPSAVDVEATCREMIEDLESTSPGWTFDLRPVGDTQGEWDGDRLSQLLSNLLSNAIQHGSPRAPVVVRIDGTKAATVMIEVNNQGAIPSEFVSVVFDAFRMARSPGPKAKGLGLGLYIAQQIARAHGGTISVRSSELDGTTFTVELPRRR